MKNNKTNRVSSAVLAFVLSFVFVVACFPLTADAATALKIKSSIFNIIRLPQNKGLGNACIDFLYWIHYSVACISNIDFFNGRY